jgi:DNA-binding transcriptional LysR family regulator
MESLRMFAAAAAEGSFTKAAALVHRTQSAVSIRMRKLEQEAGDDLFLRQGVGVELTQKGRELLEYAHDILRLHDEAVRALRRPGVAGLVRLGAPEDYAAYYLPSLLVKLAKTHPGVMVDVRSDSSQELLQALEAGDLDAALATHNQPADQAEINVEIPLCWIGPESERPERKDPLPLALFPEGCAYRKFALEALRKMGRPYRICCQSHSVSVVLAAVQSGLAIAPVASTLKAPGCRRLVNRRETPALPSVWVALHRRAQADSEAVQALADYVRVVFAGA